MKKANIVSGLIGLAIAVYVWITASKFPQNNSATDPGAAFFPKIIAAFTAVLCLILIIASLVSKKKEEGANPFALTPGMKRAFIGLAMFLLYCLLFNKLGFILDTVWLLFLCMLLMDNRKWVQMAIVSVVVPVIVYFIFSKLLYVMLPDGLLSFLF